MLAMCSPIGSLRDDAIVRWWNVERIMEEEGSTRLRPRGKSMARSPGALIGIALVLSAGVRADGFFRWLDRALFTKQFSIHHCLAMGPFGALVAADADARRASAPRS